MNLQEADKVAIEFLTEIEGFCDRVEVGGSVRRRKETVNDIEIVAVPKFEKRTAVKGLFPEESSVNVLHERLLYLRYRRIVLSDRTSKDNRKPPFSERYYRLSYKGYPIDLFSVWGSREWGVIFTIRTGSGAFSHWLVSLALKRGMKVSDGQLWKQVRPTISIQNPTNKIISPVIRFEEKDLLQNIPCPDEKSFFKALGLQWVHPERREMKGHNAQRYKVK